MRVLPCEVVCHILYTRTYRAQIHRQFLYCCRASSLYQFTLLFELLLFRYLQTSGQCFFSFSCSLQDILLIFHSRFVPDIHIFFMYYVSGYYFNSTGLLVCEPFYSQPSYRILATCSLYFPTTMILMYCYGSSFHASNFRLMATPPAATTPSSTSEKVSTNNHCLRIF